MSILLSQRPTDVPEPFAQLLRGHIERRPNLAEALGYSPQVAFLHADKAAEPWARYAGRSIKTP